MDRKFLILLLGRISALVTTLVTIAIITRKLGPVLFGYYTLVLIYAVLLSIIMDFGLQTIAIRDACDSEKSGRVVGNFIIVKLIWSFFLLFLTIITLYSLNIDAVTRVGFLLVGINLVVASAISLPTVIFHSKSQFSRLVGAECAGQFFYLCVVFLIYFYASTADALYYFWFANIVSSLATLVVGLFWATKILAVEWNIDIPLIRKMLIDSAPLMVVAVISYFNVKGDSILLSLMSSKRDLGIYSLVVRIVEIALVYPSLLMTPVFPILSKYRLSNSNINALAGKKFILLFKSGIIVLLAIFFLAPSIITVMGGAGYEDGVLALRITAFAVLIAYANSIFYYIIVVTNRQKQIIMISLSGALIGLVLNYLLIPRISFISCAMVMVVVALYGSIWMGYLAFKSSGFIPWRKYSISDG